jgi:hypothetical protein
MHLIEPSVRVHRYVQRYVLAEGALRLIVSKSDPCRIKMRSRSHLGAIGRHSHACRYRKTAARVE